MNEKIIQIFKELCDNIDVTQGSNLFRVRAISNAIKIIQQFKTDIKSSDELKNIKGIGKGILAKVDEILKTGSLEELKNINKNQKIINELSTIVGIGPVTAKMLVEKYNVKSIDDLKKKYKNNEIELNDNIIIGLKYYGRFFGSIERKEVTQIYNTILNNVDINNLTITICGSYRRGKARCNDIDILLCSLDLITKEEVDNSTVLYDCISKLKKINLIIDDITSDQVTTKYMGFCKYKNKPVRRIDIRVFPLESYFTALLYFTGSYEFNRIMRTNAKTLGYKLNEYGLYKNGKMVENITCEEDIFKILNMEYLNPEERNL